MMKRLFLFLLVLVGTLSARAVEAFRITILDAENDWPVPLVELRTVHHQRFLSDNAGVIAVDDPELMSREVWFTVRGHGYGVKKDGFGREGVRLTPSPGGEAVVRVQRQLPGKRLGRLTGAGLFAESQRFGEQLDWPESGIVGCDSVLTARHGDRLFWVWGDTLVAKYPLGLYHSSSATSSLRPLKQFEPPIRLPLEYFRDAEGAVRNVAEMPGKGPTWLGGLTSLPDQSGKERLVATYVKIRGHLTVYESGLCVWNEEMARFDRHKVLWNEERDEGKAPALPSGHPVRIHEEGKEYLLIGNPFPRVKVEATFEAWEDPSRWEALEWPTVVDSKDGKEIKVHNGSIAWNAFRQKWVSVFTRLEGENSLLGELWYAESKAPTGPWGGAVQVVEHDNYTFYNPLLHPELTEEGSPILLLEGTYTAEFADRPEPTPRYNYNQILYRLDLDDAVFGGEDAGQSRPDCHQQRVHDHRRWISRPDGGKEVISH